MVLGIQLNILLTLGTHVQRGLRYFFTVSSWPDSPNSKVTENMPSKAGRLFLIKFPKHNITHIGMVVQVLGK